LKGRSEAFDKSSVVLPEFEMAPRIVVLDEVGRIDEEVQPRNAVKKGGANR
jgi:stage III sporulation protein SpoIIIAA